MVDNIDSVKIMNIKNYPQVYLEECRYEIKKKKMVKFIDVELDRQDSDDRSSEFLNLDLINSESLNCFKSGSV